MPPVMISVPIPMSVPMVVPVVVIRPLEAGGVRIGYVTIQLVRKGSGERRRCGTEGHQSCRHRSQDNLAHVQTPSITRVQHPPNALDIDSA